jgi:hypothetical protein
MRGSARPASEEGLRLMDRKRWDTAIRCLEVALHPNTGDDEVIAAVNGFRRTADGTPLREICRALVGGMYPALEVAAAQAPSSDAIERLARENRDLRGKLDAEERGRLAATRRLHQVTRQAAKLREDMRAAQSEAAAAAERQLAELRAAQAQTIDRMNRENADLRRALDRGQRLAAAPPARPAAAAAAAPAFGTVLAAALHGAEHAEAARTRPAAPALRGAWIA